MATSSAEAIPRNEATSAKKKPLLDARRLAELVGFLLTVAGLLTALSLVSYLPRDPSILSMHTYRMQNTHGKFPLSRRKKTKSS